MKTMCMQWMKAAWMKVWMDSDGMVLSVDGAKQGPEGLEDCVSRSV